MRWTRRSAVVMVTALLVAGCGQAPRPPVERFYRLDVGTVAASREAPASGVLEVQRFSADGVVGERNLVSASGNGTTELVQLDYHLWADPPTRMLQDLTVEVLRAAAVVEQVTTPELRVSADYLLAGKIQRLEQVRTEPPGVVARVELVLTRAVDGELLWVDTLEATRPVSDLAPSSAAIALGEAVGEVLGRAIDPLASALRTGARR
ncbi:MAG: membrane integrity-associated transporter subunit PqiC [Ectothiorhodospiraceae bacterium]|nr:membrane integrity-associated transporter subunit PqiC [Chromatiales bacterium]MCP5153567.1 membrane integrity-associated transporter subunit PqiC [Ectothiorhodospiraceae bacterium]